MDRSGKILLTALLALTQILFLPGTLVGRCSLERDEACCCAHAPPLEEAEASKAPSGACCGGVERGIPALPDHGDEDDDPCPCESEPIPAPTVPVSGGEVELPKGQALEDRPMQAFAEDRSLPPRTPRRHRPRDPVGPDIYLACCVLLI